MVIYSADYQTKHTSIYHIGHAPYGVYVFKMKSEQQQQKNQVKREGGKHTNRGGRSIYG